MKKILRIIGAILAVIVVVVVVAFVVIYIASENILNKTYRAPSDAIAIPTDAAALARGKHIVQSISSCVGCHGDNLAGGVVFEDPMIGRIVAPNLTRGKNGFGGQLSDTDFIRVIRYGVLPSGKSVRVMPVEDFNNLSDGDLAAVIAYVKSAPPVDSNLPAMQIQPLARLLMVTWQLPIMTADLIDPTPSRAPDPAPSVTVEYGRYLADSAGCTSCHGPGLSGGPIPGTPPGFPKALNLTPSGELAGWTDAIFIKTIRTGLTPGGHQLDDAMPWKTYRDMTDDELTAIWLFVKSVPPRTAGTR